MVMLPILIVTPTFNNALSMEDYALLDIHVQSSFASFREQLPLFWRAADESVNSNSTGVTIRGSGGRRFMASSGEPQFFIIDTLPAQSRDRVQDVLSSEQPARTPEG